MDRLRQALDTHTELCDAFDAYLLTETHEDAEGKRIWLTHLFINGGEKAMHALAEAARAVLDAPRIWWCDYWGEGNEWPFCITQDASRHEKCRWVRLVDDPQEGGEE